MVMPVHQQCPECRNWYDGSDCLGQPCPDCADKTRKTVDDLFKDMSGRRCPKCNGFMIHGRLFGWRCQRGCR